MKVFAAGSIIIAMATAIIVAMSAMSNSPASSQLVLARAFERAEKHLIGYTKLDSNGSTSNGVLEVSVKNTYEIKAGVITALRVSVFVGVSDDEMEMTSKAKDKYFERGFTEVISGSGGYVMHLPKELTNAICHFGVDGRIYAEVCISGFAGVGTRDLQESAKMMYDSITAQ